MFQVLAPVLNKIFFPHPGQRIRKTFPFHALHKKLAMSDPSVWVSTNGPYLQMNHCIDQYKTN